MVFTTCNLADFTEVMLNNFRYFVIIAVARFTVCEECFRILCCTTCYRTLRCKRTVAETFNVFHVKQRSDIFLLKKFYLVILVRCAETIEEVKEWYACFK
ncbi:unknown [Prevotella sp. CAG:255]|nr:unknown [Prevotella sp. CAG:255]